MNDEWMNEWWMNEYDLLYVQSSEHAQWRAEGLGCPGPTRFLDAHQLKKYFSVPIHVKNLWRPYFSNFPKFYQDFFVISANYLPISTFYLSFLSEHLSGCPGPFFTFYAFNLTFSTFTCAFFQQNSVVGCPLAGCRGRHIPAPPLHATVHAAMLRIWEKSS